MSKSKIDKATGENTSGYSNINKDNITEFIFNKDKLLINLVRFIDLSSDVVSVINDLKSDYCKLAPVFKSKHTKS